MVRPARYRSAGQTLARRNAKDDLRRRYGRLHCRGVPDDYFKTEILGAIDSKLGRRHFWLLLVKQIARLARVSEQLGGLPDNVMAMTTVTDQLTAHARIPELLKTRCKWRGVSAEPLWGPLELSSRGMGLHCESCLDRSVHWCVDPVIDWVIAGGESEQDAETEPKPSHPDWFRSLRDQCAAAGVPYFLKQLGHWALRNASNGDIPFD